MNNIIEMRSYKRPDSNVIASGITLEPFSAVEVGKTMHNLIAAGPDSYKEAMQMKIELSKWRYDSLCADGDKEGMQDEYMFLCGLEAAVKELKLWRV